MPPEPVMTAESHLGCPHALGDFGQCESIHREQAAQDVQARCSIRVAADQKVGNFASWGCMTAVAKLQMSRIIAQK